MIIRNRAGSLAFAVAGAVAVIGLLAAPAAAATSLTVKVSGGGKFAGTATKTVLSDSGVGITCTSHKSTHASVASGRIANGTRSGVAPVKVNNVAKLSFGHCSSLLGAVTITASSLPASLSIDSKTSSTGKTDVIVGGINVAVSMAGCSFTVTGTSPGYYSNSKHALFMTTTRKLPKTPLVSAQLTVSNVVGCAGVVNDGDHPTYVTDYVISRRVAFKSR
jgi:hypothetical protein